MTESAERILKGSELPARLKDLRTPPATLYVRGVLPRGPATAVVGTRRPTREASEFARTLGYELARAGIAILSGGAEGIDTAAHEGALAASGSTVVVAPSSFDRPFPAQNQGLYLRILEQGGAYVSLVSPGTAARRAAFFPRNACLVGLAHVVILVEAPLRSGARNAAAQARRIGRPLFVVPSAPWNPRGAGAILELKLGARALGSSRDVLQWFESQRLYGFAPLEAGVRREGPLDSRAPRDRVLALLRRGPKLPDEISRECELPPKELQLLLLTLRLEGLVTADPSGFLTLRVV